MMDCLLLKQIMQITQAKQIIWLLMDNHTAMAVETLQINFQSALKVIQKENVMEDQPQKDLMEKVHSVFSMQLKMIFLHSNE